MACLSSWIVMIHLQNTRSFRNPHRKKSGTVRSGDRAGQAMSPKREITVPNISRTTAILFRTIWNGVLSCTVPLAANHDKLSRRRNIPIRNVSVGSAPPCIIDIEACAVQLPPFVNVTVLKSVRGDGFANSALRRKLTWSSLSVHFTSLYCRLK